MIPANALTQVEHHEGFLLVGTEGIAMHTYTLCGRQFHKHVRCTQLHSIVAWTHTLGCMCKQRCPLVFRGDGQQCYITEVADACTTQVLMTEADEHRVAMVVARAPVPATRGLSGAELHVAERHVGTEEHMAVATGSDAWIHKTGIVAVGSQCDSGQCADYHGEPHCQERFT